MKSNITESNIQFFPDTGLLYLIQQNTKQPTEDILGFFYDFGKEVLIKGIEGMKVGQRNIRKDIRDFYPNTAIPFKMLVESYRGHSGQIFRSHISVSFPSNITPMNTKEIINLIAERHLLGGSSLPAFEKPRVESPKMYKKLIKEVLKKNE
jgi:hypothetical protein